MLQRQVVGKLRLLAAMVRALCERPPQLAAFYFGAFHRNRDLLMMRDAP